MKKRSRRGWRAVCLLGCGLGLAGALRAQGGAAAEGPAPRAASLALWAIGENVRIDPETGRAIEENAQVLPGGLRPGYRDRNAVWDAKSGEARLFGGRNEVVAFQVIVQGKAEKVSAHVSALKGPDAAKVPRRNIQLYREWYIYLDAKTGNARDKGCRQPLGEHWYPDAAIPLSEERFGNGFSIPSRDFHDPQKKHFPKQKNVSFRQACVVEVFSGFVSRAARVVQFRAALGRAAL